MENLEKKDKFINIDVVDEMENSFLDYAMSIITSRAIPDVRDGLKPVHRRILFAMNQISNYSDKPYQKSARTVGEVIGKYHPHGDTSVYEAMVKMAQDFSYRYVLIDGHGNFGSQDGDRAAAMRYTEARMSKLAMYMVSDINKDTIDYQLNYDGKEKEPTIMPCKFPNILVNGTTGIAVGMATSIPPHNLSEVISALLILIDNRDLTLEEIMHYIKGPDFPTGNIILGVEGIKQAYETGKGSIKIKATATIETNNQGKEEIIINDFPFQVNKAGIIKKIADLVREKVIEGISEIRDESNHEGIRCVVTIKNGFIPEVVLNKIYKHTRLQGSFSFNNVVLVKGQPKILNLKDTLNLYLDHQIEVIIRRTKFDLKKAEDKIHILKGLEIAIQNIDEVVQIIKSSRNTEEAKINLINRFSLSEIQAKAIVEMRLRSLTGLEIEKLLEEVKKLEVEITEYKEILSNESKRNQVIKDELENIKNKFGDKRKTIIDVYGSNDIQDEDLIPKENIVITLSKSGYIKRTPVKEYNAQHRGGKGVKGQSVVEDDSVYKMITTTTHTDVLFFSTKGKTYRIRAHKIPKYLRQAKGMPIINLLKIEKNEKIQAILTLNEYKKDHFFFFVTEKGIVKKTSAELYKRISITGKKAISLKENDNLLDVKLTTGNDEILLANSNGKVIRFSEQNVRSSGRTAFGMKGMNVDGGHIISLVISNIYKYLLSVSSKGTGKLTPIHDYRKIKRGGKGVKTIKISHKTGKLAETLALNGEEEILLISNSGKIIRLKVEQINKSSRNTQGVKLMNLGPGEVIKKVTKIVQEKQDEEKNENHT